jgi:hypothetical protein
VGDLIQQSDGALPYHRLAASLAPYHLLARRLLNGDQPDQVRDAVLLLAVEIFHLAGRMAFNLKDHSAARWNATEADRLHAQLPEGAFSRWWLAARARVARFREHDLDAALTLAQRACRAFPSESNYVGFWVHCVQAEMYSHHGKESAARQSIDLARHFADRIKEAGPSDGDPYAFLFPEARFGGLAEVLSRISAYEGTCCLRANQLDDAERAFVDVLATLPPGGVEAQHAFVLADLATVEIRRGDLESACARLVKAVDLAEQTGARIPLRRVQRARRELSPWADSRPVRELDERLLGPIDV